ncbi:MAG: hypothetical protein MUO61_05370 [Dehalococcoidia bacterium]|nr:hypothetical protein [Dehalococcoidia bacterium]
MNSSPADNFVVDITGFGLVCPDITPKMFDLPKGTRRESCPVYSCACQLAQDVLPAGKLRRIGHCQKMAIAASALALADFLPEQRQNLSVAVTVGTGLGALEQTTLFLENMFTNHESQPKPACFINSVHNSVASQIAMTFGFKQEAHTFTHDSISFELALNQAINILRFGRADYVITCGVDELNPYLLAYGEDCQWWKNQASPLAPMSQGDNTYTGTIAGEGAAAFLLGRSGHNSKSHSIAKLLMVHAMPMQNYPRTSLNISAELGYISRILLQNGISLKDIDFFLFGANGNAASDAQYIAVKDAITDMLGNNIRYGAYKHLCGEYCTASAVGLAVVLSILRQSTILPKIEISIPSVSTRSISSVLLYNLSRQGYRSLCVVSL